MRSHPDPGKTEFVILIAATMMIVAFAIDSMLPALPAIGTALGADTGNERQFVISAFLIGFGVAQLFAGIISDRFGRRIPLLVSLFGFLATSLAAAAAPSFDWLLIARVGQGIACAGARVAILSVVRDRFEGRAMAQVMSLASMMFMAAPILAPTMGQLVLEFGPWRWIFWVLAAIGAILFGWVLVRLPETLDRARRIPIALNTIFASGQSVITDRMSLGYSLASSVISCALFGFLLSVQQVFDQVFNNAKFLPTGFAIMAAGMAAASLLNASIVKRYGMRRIGHSALFFFTAVAGLHMVVALAGRETIITFIGLQTVMMMGFALVMGNFSAMAMQNMGNVAGMASALQGSLANIAGAVVGTLIGQSFDGTTVPLYVAYFVCGLAALVIVFITEGGQFFASRSEAASDLAHDGG